jgi:hypothetical protein
MLWQCDRCGAKYDSTAKCAHHEKVHEWQDRMSLAMAIYVRCVEPTSVYSVGDCVDAANSFYDGLQEEMVKPKWEDGMGHAD